MNSIDIIEKKKLEMKSDKIKEFDIMFRKSVEAFGSNSGSAFSILVNQIMQKSDKDLSSFVLDPDTSFLNNIGDLKLQEEVKFSGSKSCAKIKVNIDIWRTKVASMYPGLSGDKLDSLTVDYLFDFSKRLYAAGFDVYINITGMVMLQIGGDNVNALSKPMILIDLINDKEIDLAKHLYYRICVMNGNNSIYTSSCRMCYILDAIFPYLFDKLDEADKKSISILGNQIQKIDVNHNAKFDNINPLSPRFGGIVSNKIGLDFITNAKLNFADISLKISVLYKFNVLKYAHTANGLETVVLDYLKKQRKCL